MIPNSYNQPQPQSQYDYQGNLIHIGSENGLYSSLDSHNNNSNNNNNNGINIGLNVQSQINPIKQSQSSQIIPGPAADAAAAAVAAANHIHSSDPNIVAIASNQAQQAVQRAQAAQLAQANHVRRSSYTQREDIIQAQQQAAEVVQAAQSAHVVEIVQAVQAQQQHQQVLNPNIVQHHLSRTSSTTSLQHHLLQDDHNNNNHNNNINHDNNPIDSNGNYYNLNSNPQQTQDINHQIGSQELISLQNQHNNNINHVSLNNGYSHPINSQQPLYNIQQHQQSASSQYNLQHQQQQQYQQLPQQVPQQVPQQIPQQLPQQIPQQLPQQIPQQYVQQYPMQQQFNQPFYNQMNNLPFIFDYMQYMNPVPTIMQVAARITQVPYQNSYYQPVVYHQPWAIHQDPRIIQGTSSISNVTSQSNKEYIDSTLKLAHDKYNSQDYSGAFSILQNLYQLDNRHLRTLLLLGCTCYSLQMYQLSIQYNNQILQIDSQFAEAYSNLGTTYRAMAMSTDVFKAQNNNEELQNAEANMALSEQCYRLAISIRPKYWDASVNLSGLLTGIGRNEEALKVYEEFENVYESEYPNEERFDTVDTSLSDAEFVNVLVHRENLRRVGKRLESPNTSIINSPIDDIPLTNNNTTNINNSTTTNINDTIPKKKHIANRANKSIKKNGYSDDRRSALYYAKGSIRYNLGDVIGAKQEYLRGLVCMRINVQAAYKSENQNHLPQHTVTPALAMLSLQNQKSPSNATTSSILQTLAKIYQDSNQIFLAVNFYYSALSIHANANTCNNLGIILAQTRLNEAIAWYEFGLGLEHNHVHLLTNLGSALKDRGQINEGIQCYQRAIALNPDFFIALANLANVFKDLGRIEEAGELYQRALRVKPDFIEAFCNYVNSLFFMCNWKDRLINLTKIKEIVDNQLKDRPLINILELHNLKKIIADSKEIIPKTVPTVLPFHTFTYAGLQAFHVREISRRNAERVTFNTISSDWFPGFSEKVNSIHWPYPYEMPMWNEEKQEKINIGYLSSDFNNHPLAHLMQSVFGFHDRNKFNVFCYALSQSDMSPYRIKIEQEADVFIDVTQWSIDQIVTQIRNDKIHVLCNLNGYTKGGRNEIFAARPSPVQFQFMGFAGTLGAGEVFDPDKGLISPSSLIKYSGFNDEEQDMLLDFEGIQNRWLDFLVTDEIACPRHLVVGEPIIDESISDDIKIKESIKIQNGDDINVTTTGINKNEKDQDSLETSITLLQKGEGIRNEFGLLDRGLVRNRDDGSRIYTEALCYMPYSYFVNDHRQGFRDQIDNELEAIISNVDIERIFNLSIKLDLERNIINDINQNNTNPNVNGNNTGLLERLPKKVNVLNIKDSIPIVNSIGSLIPINKSKNQKAIKVNGTMYYTDELDDEKLLTPNQRKLWRREQLRRLKMRSDVFPWIREDTVIFANFNQLYKLDPLVFDTWLKILERVPNSILWLLRFPPAGENHLRKYAIEKSGIQIANRVVFTDVAPKHIHIHRGRVADIFLDTPECNAHTTAADILWSGTPVITYPKYDFKMCSRVCASIAYATGDWSKEDIKDLGSKLNSNKYGLPHKRDNENTQYRLGNWMVVNSYKEYEDLAVSMANEIEWVWKPLTIISSLNDNNDYNQDKFKNCVIHERKELYNSLHKKVKKYNKNNSNSNNNVNIPNNNIEDAMEECDDVEMFKNINEDEDEDDEEDEDDDNSDCSSLLSSEDNNNNNNNNNDKDDTPPVPFFTPFHPSRQSPKYILVQRCDSLCARLRRSLFLNRDNMPLFDTPKWVNDLESGIIKALQKWKKAYLFRQSLNQKILLGESIDLLSSSNLTIKESLTKGLIENNNDYKDPISILINSKDSKYILKSIYDIFGIEIIIENQQNPNPNQNHICIIKIPKLIYNSSLNKELSNITLNHSNGNLNYSLNSLSLSEEKNENEENVINKKGFSLDNKTMQILNNKESKYLSKLSVKSHNLTIDNIIFESLLKLYQNEEPKFINVLKDLNLNNLKDLRYISKLDKSNLLNDVIVCIRRRVNTRCIWVNENI